MKERVKKLLEKYKFWLLLLIGIGVFIDIFFFGPIRDLVVLLLTGFWVLAIWLYGFEGRISIGGGLIFLALCPFLLIFNQETIAGRTAIWAYMFLAVGLGQMIIEYIREERRNTRGQK